MTWSEIDLEAAPWSVPAERMKMGRPHQIPLAPQTIDAVRRAEVLRAPCTERVYRGRRLKPPVSETTLLVVMRDFELPYTVHGLRCAFRDWVAEDAICPREIAEVALAHANSYKVEAAYRRTEFLEKRQSLMRVG